MDTLDLSGIKEGDVLSLLNEDKNLFSGTLVKVHKGCLAVAVSVKQKNYTQLNEKDYFKFFCASKNKAVRCSSVVLGSSFNNDVQILLISNPKVITAIERRQFKRLQTVIDIDYYFLPENKNYERISEVEPLWLKKMKRSFTVDISAGGVSLITYENDSEKKQAIISFRMNEEEIVALCNVSRIEDAVNNKKTVLEFIDIKREHVELIDAYVIDKLKNVV